MSNEVKIVTLPEWSFIRKRTLAKYEYEHKNKPLNIDYHLGNHVKYHAFDLCG